MNPLSWLRTLHPRAPSTNGSNGRHSPPEHAEPNATATFIDIVPALDRDRELAEIRIRLLALEWDQRFIGPVLGILVHNSSRASRRNILAALDEIEAKL